MGYEFAKGGKTGKYTIHLSKDLGLDDEFRYHVVGPDGGVIGCQSKKECQEVISLAKRGMIEMEKGGKTQGEVEIILTDDDLGYYSILHRGKFIEKEFTSLKEAEDWARANNYTYKESFAKGGKTMTPSDIVSLLTDEEVAKELVDKMFETLESVDFDVDEKTALTQAKDNIEHSRKMLIEILEHQA